MIRVFVVLFLFERSLVIVEEVDFFSGGGFFQTKHIDLIVPGRSSHRDSRALSGCSWWCSRVTLSLAVRAKPGAKFCFNCQRTRTQILTISRTIIPLFTHKAHMESLLGSSHVFSNVKLSTPNRKSLRQPLNLTSSAAPLLSLLKRRGHP